MGDSQITDPSEHPGQDAEGPGTAAYLVAHPHPHPAFDQFVATVAALRAPDGCPWDRVQTHASVSQNMIEEAYEALDAIEASDIPHMREELGDVLLQVVLQSQIGADAGEFSIDDVCRDVNDKIIRRHPHVFGDAKAGDANAVLAMWDRIKLSEGHAGSASAEGTQADGGKVEDAQADGSADAEKTAPEGLLDGVPKSLPALMQAQKVSRKAASAGFEWDTLEDIWAKVAEEIAELREAYKAAPKASDGRIPNGSENSKAAAVEMEFGDVLFALVNVGRRMGVDTERALRSSCAKFRRRWAFIEGAARSEGREVQDMGLDGMEALWQQAKASEIS